MSRKELKEQKQYEFRCTITLQPRDINYEGHLGAEAITSLVNNAQATILHGLGFNEEDLGDGQTGITISELAVNLKTQAFVFDELQIHTHFGEFRRNSFRIFHRITKGLAVVALVETGITAFNRDSSKIAAVPKTLLKALTEKQV